MFDPTLQEVAKQASKTPQSPGRASILGLDLKMGGAGAPGTFGSHASLSDEVTIDVGSKERGLFDACGLLLPMSMLTPRIPSP